MTDINCKYIGDREATLIAYLYDDVDPGERSAVEAHLAECARCRTELSALGGVRQQLARWNPPTFERATQPSSLQPSSPSRSLWWAQAAAALLFLGVSAGIANLNVRYDANGITVRTGWLNRDAAATKAADVRPKNDTTAARVEPAAANATADAAFASKADLAALEQRLRDQLRTTPAAAASVRSGAADADLLRRVRAILDESEKRQQRELALRLAQAMSDVAVQRQADLRKIDTTLNGVQRDLGIQVLQQRERMNYLMRVNQRQ